MTPCSSVFVSSEYENVFILDSDFVLEPLRLWNVPTYTTSASVCLAFSVVPLKVGLGFKTCLLCSPDFVVLTSDSGSCRDDR